MTNQQYYTIDYNSEYIWSDREYKIFKSQKDAINYCKKQIELLKDEYINKDERIKEKFYKVYKRLNIDNIYRNIIKPKGKLDYKIIGKVIELRALPKTPDYDHDPFCDQVLAIYLTRILKNDLERFTKFREVGE